MDGKSATAWLCALALGLGMGLATSAPAAQWKVDTSHTSVAFSVSHLFTSVQGRFDRFEGTIDFDPGDPAATGVYAIPTIKQLIAFGVPIFGICLGHQILALALGAKTKKMHHGHRGANHPVKDLKTGKVEITSQNHGFVVDGDSLPAGVVTTHISLFDQSVEGIEVTGKPIFAVQYHPEASPGPHDSHYLFQRFVKLIDDHA